MWQLQEKDESALSTIMPIEDTGTERKQPWLLHSLAVNALNFCSFAMCYIHSIIDFKAEGSSSSNTILVATPGVQDGWINVTSFPSETRVATISSPKDTNTGMVMTIGLFHKANELTVTAGYESGHAVVWQQDRSSKVWDIKYMNKSHTQPVLSLDIMPDGKHFFTSSADALIIRHPLLDRDSAEPKMLQSKHAGQQSLTVRSDGKIFGTAGWDGRMRVYSPKSMKELAVLKWHKEGCYAMSFALLEDSVTDLATGLEDNSSVARRESTVAEQRIEKAKSTRWLAAGSKDGKVSLWDVY